MDKLLNKIFEENFVEINNFSNERLDYIKNTSFECDFDCNENRKIKEIILFNSDDEYLAVRGVEVLNENKNINYPHEIIYGSIKSNRGNAFGFIRTFSLWSDEEKYQYLSSCNELITLLRTFTPHVCYAYGTVLGFVRECSGFIPHDCDIDILVSLNQNQYSNISDFYEDLFPYFEDKGVKIEKSDNYHLHVKYKNTHRIDIFPTIIDNDSKILLFPKRTNKYLPFEIMYPTIDIDVMGLNCPVPKNPFKFLDSVYGNNWRVPLDKSFRNVDDPNKQ